MTAVAALPDLHFALLKDLQGFHILQQLAVALFVVLLNGSNQAELGCQLLEAFLLSGLGKACIHIGPLVVLAFCSVQQVFSGITDAVQFLEPQLCMFLFVFGSLQEQGCDLLEAFLLSLGCKIGILVSGLGFAGKSGFQVFLGLSACIFVSHKRILLNFIDTKILA